jgi:tetratricopeptide (TPR) repeat protein
LLERTGRCVERGYYELALVACSVRDASRLEESAAVALDLAIEFKDPDLEARALADGGLALINQGQLTKGFARLDEAMAAVTSGEVRDPVMGGTIYCALLTACERTGELRRAEEWTQAATDFAVKRFAGALPILHAHCRLAYGTVLCDAGRWPEAEEQIIGLVGHSSTQSVPKLAAAAGYLANLRMMQGRIDEAAEVLAPYADYFEVCEPLARLHFRKGEFDLAGAVISRALAELVGDRLRAGKLLALLVDVELARGDVEAADRAAERLADYAADSDSAVLSAESSLADGRVATARQMHTSAVEAFESGLSALSKEERPILSATIRLDLAQALASSDVPRATDEARVALATFERVGAPRDIERSVELLGRLGSSATVA